MRRLAVRLGGLVLRRLQGPEPALLGEAIRTFRPALEGQGRALRRIGVLTMVMSVLELARPWPMKLVFDRVFVGGQASRGPGNLSADGVLVAAALVAVAVPLLIGHLNLRTTVTSAEVSRKATTRIRREVFRHLHHLDLPFHQANRTGDLLVRLMGDVNMVRDLLFASWVNFLARGAVVVGTAAVMLVLDPFLALVAMAPVPFLALSVARRSRELKQVTRKQRRREGDAAAFAAESLRQIRVVKAYAGENKATERFARDARSGEKAGVRAAHLAGRMARLTEALTGAGVALVLLVGGRRVLSGALSPGDLLVFISYTRSLYKPVRKISNEGGRMSKATACAERLLEVLRVEPEPAGCGRRAPRFCGELIVRGVRYRYAGGREALRGISFDVGPGELAVLAGHNGSGKSTLLGVLLRLFEPDGGMVLMDGQPIGAFDLGSYRAQLAFVPQEPQLFGATIRENILYGRPDADDADVEAAARAAFFDAVVARLPDGYETVLGENGASLSGGEARRLMLARAALRDARVLLLDEPLAGLDPEARPVVAQAIRRIGTGRTTVVVSHGHEAELDPDVVVRLADGRVQAVERRHEPRRWDRPPVGSPQ